MILYVNGDSHSAGAEAVNSFAFAEDDSKYYQLGRQPHPDNLKVSYGAVLADKIGATLYCDAESASSNSRIVRSTLAYLDKNPAPDLVLIGWSTWEREEWWHEETRRFWQVNAGGVGDDWPDEIKDRYKGWIVNLNYDDAVFAAHEYIWRFHKLLQKRNINHFFFNSFLPFHYTADSYAENWDGCYLAPYNPDFTYYNWLTAQGFKPVNPKSYHFGPDAHQAWADFLLEKMVLAALTR